MKIMDRALSIFIYIWVGIFAALNLIGVIGQFYLQGFSGGLSYIQEMYSPFNILNYIVMMASLTPAMGVYYWREKRRNKKMMEDITSE
jgi:hypothetical protein